MMNKPNDTLLGVNINPIASEQGYLEVVRELLAAGADHTLVIDDQRKETSLVAARRNGHHNIVQLLQEYGAIA